MTRSLLSNLALCLGVVLASAEDSACTSTDCSESCGSAGPATLQLSCAANLTAVNVSGPCATAPNPTDPAAYGYLDAGTSLSISSPSAGTCHVVLTFASGFTSATDVVFTVRGASHTVCGICTPYLAPAQGVYTVDSAGACGDAGAVDVGADTGEVDATEADGASDTGAGDSSPGEASTGDTGTDP